MNKLGSNFSRAALLSLAALLSGFPAFAQMGKALTADDRARAIAIEGTVTHDKSESASIAGAPDKSVITSVVPIGTPLKSDQASGSKPNRRAEISRFEYATGVTVRTVVDLDAGTVLATRRTPNFPTPLAPAELEEAKALLIKQVPDIAAIVTAAGPGNVEFMHLVSVAPSTSSKRYGHRVVVLWINKPERTSRYTVNLTTGTVE